MDQTTQLAVDISVLEALNADYIHSDQFNDVARYEQMLAPDFLVQLPDLKTRDRAAFLDMIAQPRPFTGLTAHDVTIRVFGDVALVHGRVTYTTVADNVDREALYTDTYRRCDGGWTCVAASVIAQGV
ncbi:nuclear transport factor 2 family protein [Umezawaea sp. NPDC059074]|uniref:nuclear transport factor 2 family protein n=1 Tax=Umezawaea sp. NPDC059074 TaxID=3346716 RepID=UPI0036BB9EF6